MVNIPWPLDTNPGQKPQEGTGRLINVYPEARGDGSAVYHRAPGATVFARNPSSGTIEMEVEVLGRSETLLSTFFSFIGSTFAALGSAGTQTYTFSGDAAENDLLFLAYAADNATSITTPSGWTPIGTTVSFMAAQCMWKVSTGERTVDLNIPNASSVVLTWTIRGADTVNPIVDTATVSTGASLQPVPPNFTATTADCLMINVSWLDDDNASAVVAPTTVTIGGGSTFGMGGNLFATSTGASGSNGATVMVGMRPLATTGAITATTWAVTGGDDEWASLSFTVRHD